MSSRELQVEDRQVEPRAVEVVLVFHVGVAAHEAAHGAVLVIERSSPLASSPSRMAALSSGERGLSAQGVADHLQARADPVAEGLFVLARGDHLVEEGMVGGLLELQQGFALPGDIAGPSGPRAAPPWRAVVLVVGAEGNHDAAGHVVREQVLELTQKGRLGSASERRSPCGASPFRSMGSLVFRSSRSGSMCSLCLALPRAPSPLRSALRLNSA